MNCSSAKCFKPMKLSFSCELCKQSFCSSLCLSKHKSTYHKIDTKLNPSHFQMSKSKQTSIFAKKGELLKEIKYEPLYEFVNFEYLMIGKKKQILGTGAFGEVFLAKNKINGALYAIKHMHKKKIMDNGASLDIVLREIEIHKRLIHPNIIRMYSNFEDKDSYYLILDYAKNQTVFNLIKKMNGMSESESFKYFIDAVSAVNFLHENNFVHRDLKPENMLIDDNGDVKLCDFGWCVDLQVGSRSTFCGTYEYMAPEIINEAPYDFGIDVWSLGILLYELLHGYSPFRAKKKCNQKEYVEIFRNIVNYKFKIDKEISENCKDLLKNLLEPNNKKRMNVKDIFSHPWVQSFEKDYINHKSYQASKDIIGLDLHVSSIDSNRAYLNEDFEQNIFYNPLDSSRNLDLNRSFDSTSKINNDLKRLNTIINNTVKVVHNEMNFTKNTIVYNHSSSNDENLKKINSSTQNSNKEINSSESKVEAKVPKNNSNDKNKSAESNIEDKIKKLSSNNCILLIDELAEEPLPVAQSKKEMTEKEKEEVLLRSKEKLKKSIESSKSKLIDDLNLKMSSHDETMKMSVFRNSQGSLFDKVLSQVQQKNKTKKLSKRNLNWNESFDKRCIIQSANKIYIMADKPNGNTIAITKPVNFSIDKENMHSDIALKQREEYSERSVNPLIEKLMLPEKKSRIQENTHLIDLNSVMIEKRKIYNSDSSNLRALNDLLINDKEIIKNKIDFSGVSQIENNRSTSQKISPSLISIDNEEKNRYFSNFFAPKQVFEIQKTELLIKAYPIPKKKNQNHDESLSDDSEDPDSLVFTKEDNRKYLKKRKDLTMAKAQSPKELQEKKCKDRKVLRLKLFEDKKNKTKKKSKKRTASLENKILRRSTIDKENNLVLYASIEILEKSIDNKNKLIRLEENVGGRNFWAMINPFKCGSYT